MTTIPKSRELVFKQNQSRSDIYDLIGSRFHGFTFLRLSEPRSEFLIRQGAKYVIESWDHGQKPLFSGLRPIKEGLYYGDRFANGKRSLLIVRIQPHEIIIHLFQSYPRIKRLQEILRCYRETINPGNHPRVNLSPTEPMNGPISNTKVNNLG
jgi:hypothetical protein